MGDVRTAAVRGIAREYKRERFGDGSIPLPARAIEAFHFFLLRSNDKGDSHLGEKLSYIKDLKSTSIDGNGKGSE